MLLPTKDDSTHRTIKPAAKREALEMLVWNVRFRSETSTMKKMERNYLESFQTRRIIENVNWTSRSRI